MWIEEDFDNVQSQVTTLVTISTSVAFVTFGLMAIFYNRDPENPPNIAEQKRSKKIIHHDSMNSSLHYARSILYVFRIILIN